MDLHHSAQEIVRHIGGVKNVGSLYHCATRLRFRLKDTSKADKAALERVEGVISVVEGAGQLQVVIGGKVAKVYQELIKIHPFSNVDEGGVKEPFLTRAIGVLSGLFQPLIPALAGAGLIKGIIAIGMVSGLLSGASTSYMLLNVAADGVFYFLPVFLAITAARKFGANEFLALGIAAALCHPMIEVAYTAVSAVGSDNAHNILQALTLQNFGGMKDILVHYGYPEQVNNLHWFGIPFILMHYGYSVIPIIIAVWALSYVERWVYAAVPEIIRLLVAPMLVLLIMVPLTFLVVGPIGGAIGDGLAWLLKTLNDFSGMLFGAFLGFFWQIMVIFGVHWSTTPITFNNFALLGYDYLSPITAVGVLGQVGAGFAVAVKSRNRSLKSLGISTGITGALGITEPLLYGVTLKLKKPFLYGCIGGAVGGALAGAGGALSYAYAFGGVLALPSYLGPQGNLSSMLFSLAGMTVAAGVAFVLTWFLGFTDLPEVEAAPENAPDVYPDVKTVQKSTLAAPLTGAVVPLAEVKDPAFAAGSMGQGIAIRPDKGELCAPCDGTIAAIFPTRHVVVISDACGAEIMMHIGLDTVDLKGEGFTALVANGDRVKQGDPLIRFDLDALTAKGYDLTTPVILINSDDYATLETTTASAITIGEPLLTAIPKTGEHA